jgi:hypothetical protein
MSINLIDLILKRTPFQGIKKIDPNIQDINGKEVTAAEDLVGQAAIPAVLAAVYKHSRMDADAERLLNGPADQPILPFLFNHREGEVSERIAQYAGVDAGRARTELETVANESLHTIREFLGREATPQRLKTFMNDQRHNILVYLPAQLQLGDSLKDEAIDDRTNKMEGPVSNFMHKIENKLSQGGE